MAKAGVWQGIGGLDLLIRHVVAILLVLAGGLDLSTGSHKARHGTFSSETG
jgi:hypothetical protein